MGSGPARCTIRARSPDSVSVRVAKRHEGPPTGRRVCRFAFARRILAASRALGTPPTSCCGHPRSLSPVPTKKRADDSTFLGRVDQVYATIRNLGERYPEQRALRIDFAGSACATLRFRSTSSISSSSPVRQQEADYRIASRFFSISRATPSRCRSACSLRKSRCRSRTSLKAGLPAWFTISPGSVSISTSDSRRSPAL